jgi:adenine-specific DNA-methyltransferase
MSTKPTLRIQTTTLWDYPSQHYGIGMQGDKDYAGATPSYIIWNLLQRYTKPGDLVIDPCAGSGTTLAVARDLSRKARGFDLAPYHTEIELADARHLPLADKSVDFVFIDPPYSTHLDYSDDARCIGKLDAESGTYYEAMEKVIEEIDRVLKDGKYMALYVSDSFKKGKPLMPIGFELFMRLREFFEPVDIISVTRHNAKLNKGNFHKAAEEENFFLRGFNYLFIMKKPNTKPLKPQKTNWRNLRSRAHPSEQSQKSHKPLRTQSKPNFAKRQREETSDKIATQRPAERSPRRPGRG